MPKISELTSQATPTTTAVVPVVQSGTTYKATLLSLFDTLAAYIHSATGAVYRTFTNKLRETISVKDFGAVGDGVTDDTSAIQAAITYLESVTDYRPTLYFPYGIYRVTSTFTTTARWIRIAGAGRGRVRLQGDTHTTFKGGSAILYDGAVVTPPNGLFNFGTADSTDGSGGGISMQDIALFCQWKCDGIKGTAWFMARLSNVYIHRPLTGIYSRYSGFSSIFDMVEIHDPETGGIDLREACHSVTMLGCMFNGDANGTKTPTFALRIAQDGNCSNVTVIGCNFDFYRVAAHVDLVTECRGFNFHGNYIECKGDGVTANAVLLREGDGVSITGNRITSGDSPTPTVLAYGVELRSGCTGVNITGNYFNGFDTAGIRVSSGATNVHIAGNECDGGLTEYVDQNTRREVISATSGLVKAKAVSANRLSFGTPITYTITAGIITIDETSRINVDTEASAATDDLDTINGASEAGQLLIIQTLSSSRDVTVKDATGNIQLASDFVHLSGRDKLTLIWNATSSFWEEVCRSTN